MFNVPALGAILATLKALFHQPGGSAIRRRTLSVWLVAVSALAALVLAFVAGAVSQWYVLLPLLVTTATALFTSSLVDRRRAPLDATLDLLPGAVVVRDAAGKIWTTLTARSVLGATTARLEEGVSLVLALKPAGSTPAVLRLADEAAADEVRRSLGVGPAGFGSAQWSIGAARYGGLRAALRFGWRALVLAMVFLGVVVDKATPIQALLVQFTLYVGFAALVMRLAHAKEPPLLQLSPAGLLGHARGKDGLYQELRIPFAAIRSVELGQGTSADTLVVDCAPPYGSVVFETRPTRTLRGVDVEERAHIVAQIQAAVERARLPSFVAERASRLELLRRGQDTARAWLARLDALAHSLKGAHNYRAAAIDDADLWNALETPEIDAELRTAAARVLVQASQADARTRIEATLSAERDPTAAKRIRVALEPDTELAVQELDEIERRQLARRH